MERKLRAEDFDAVFDLLLGDVACAQEVEFDDGVALVAKIGSCKSRRPAPLIDLGEPERRVRRP